MNDDWDSILPTTRKTKWQRYGSKTVSLIVRRPVLSIILLGSLSWFVFEFTKLVQLRTERASLIQARDAFETKLANHGELVVDAHAKQNLGVPAIQLLKSESERAFRWEVYWPKDVPCMVFNGNVELGSDGEIRRLLGGAASGYQGQALRLGVVFYREAQFYLASGSVYRPKGLGERIQDGFRGVSKRVCGEDAIYLHQDPSRPVILLQAMLEEDVGKPNAVAYVMAIMSSDVHDRLRKQATSLASEAL
jgi:hypothetical protein